jgi:hypothetical protein
LKSKKGHSSISTLNHQNIVSPLTYRIGNRDDVRGLWFYDKEFMGKFVRVLENICNDIRVSCDGSYERLGMSPQTGTPSSNGGKAILQLLKKDSPYFQTAPSRGDVTVDVRSLLRKEFASPSTTTPKPEANHSSFGSPQIAHSQVPQSRSGDSVVTRVESNYGRPVTTTPRKPPNHENVTISRDDVRAVLNEVINSEEFLSLFYEKLCSRCRR